MIIEGKRNDDNLTYKKLRKMWRSMMDRCYNKSHPSYKNYGGSGVVVSEKWKTLDGFISTIDTVKGFNLEKLLKGEISLDKDTIVKGNKEYVADKCCFISREENNRHKPNQQRAIAATSPSGEEFIFSNQSEFAKKHNLSQGKISSCINKKIKHHKKWKFKLYDEVEEL